MDVLAFAIGFAAGSVVGVLGGMALYRRHLKRNPEKLEALARAIKAAGERVRR